MESGNQHLTAEGPAAVATGPTYPVLVLRWWLVCARQEARAAVKSVRPGDTDDDRRLAAFAVAGVMVILLLIGCVVAGFSATSSVAIIALGFFGTLFAGLALLLWSEDDEVAQERVTVASLLPDAKRVWDEQRAAAKATRAARRAQAQYQGKGNWRSWLVDKKAGLMARHRDWRSARTARAEAAAEADLVPLVPIDGRLVSPWLPGDGTFPISVVSEIHLPRILQSVVGGLPGAGENQVVPAALRVEGSEDRTAVSVLVGGRVVGHLSQIDARAFRNKVANELSSGPEFRCRAVIHGEADLGRVRHGLRLDVSL